MASDIKHKIISLLVQVFPEQMLAVDSQTLTDLLQKASRGRFGIDKAYQLQESSSSTLNSLNRWNLALIVLTLLFFLKLAAMLATFVAAFKDTALNKFYEKNRAEGKDNVMGHVCHKLLSIIFAVMRNNKDYIPILT